MRARRPAITLLVATILVVWGLITHGTYAGSGDEVHYLMMARSLAFDGDLDLRNDYADPHNLVGGGTARAEAHLQPGRNGVLRPVHDIGLPLLAAPLVRFLYPLALWIEATAPRAVLQRAKLNASLVFRHQLSLLMAVVAGLIAIEVWWALRGAGLAERPAFWWALLTTLSPPLLSFAFLFFTELVAALIVLTCSRRILDPSWTRRGWLLTGVLVGLLTLIHIRNGPISVALAVIAVATHWGRRRPLASFAIGIAAVAAIRTAVHWHFWGTLVVNHHARLGGFESGILRETAVRVSGLFLDQEFGLLTLAPVYLLAVPGLVRLWRHAPHLAKPLSAVVAAGTGSIVLPLLNPYGFAEGWSPAPRFLVPIVPLLAIAVGFGAHGTAGLRRVFIASLVALQVLVDVVVWNEPKILWDNRDGVSALTQVVPALDSVFTTLPTWHGPNISPWPFVIGALLWTALSVWLLRGRSGAERSTPAL